MSHVRNNRMQGIANYLKLVIMAIIIINIFSSFFIIASEYGGSPDDGGTASNLERPKAGTLYLSNQQDSRYEGIRLSTDVSIQITGLTARVKVVQAFRNDSSHWVEGKYQFPLPDKAAVDHLSIRIGERIIVGEIKEKQAARKIYQQAKISGRKAALVEQQRPNLFSNSVANIGPYETIEVTIEYQQDVRFELQKGFSLRFPMTITPRYQPSKFFQESFSSFDQALNGQDLAAPWLSVGSSKFQNYRADEIDEIDGQANRVSLQVSLDSGMALKRLSSPSHSIIHQQKTERDYQISFQKNAVVANNDFILNWQPVDSQTPRAALFAERKAGENYISVMIMPPSQSLYDEQSPNEKIDREVIFVIDTSGSMGGTSIQQATAALNFGLSTLAPSDKFNVIQFNSETEWLFNRAKLASPQNLSSAKSYVDGLKAEGGTEMFSAIEASLDGINDHSMLRQVIFLTDGAISNESSLFKLIDQRLGDSRLYTVGIGSAPNAFFMKKAAKFGRGSFTFIQDIQQAQRKIETLFDKISRPKLTHIAIDWPQSVTAEVWPNKLPDLYHGEPLWLKAKVNQLEGEIRVSGRLSQIQWQSDLLLENSKRQAGIAVLWAREKIAAIMNDAHHGQVDAQQKQQIIDTAIEHHIVSRFTSLIAVDKTPSRYAETLRQQVIKNQIPKGHSVNRQSINYPATGLDLDIVFEQSFILFLLSLILLFVYRRIF